MVLGKHAPTPRPTQWAERLEVVDEDVQKKSREGEWAVVQDPAPKEAVSEQVKCYGFIIYLHLFTSKCFSVL